MVVVEVVVEVEVVRDVGMMMTSSMEVDKVDDRCMSAVDAAVVDAAVDSVTVHSPHHHQHDHHSPD